MNELNRTNQVTGGGRGFLIVAAILTVFWVIIARIYKMIVEVIAAVAVGSSASYEGGFSLFIGTLAVKSVFPLVCLAIVGVWWGALKRDWEIVALFGLIPIYSAVLLLFFMFLVA